MIKLEEYLLVQKCQIAEKRIRKQLQQLLLELTS